MAHIREPVLRASREIASAIRYSVAVHLALIRRTCAATNVCACSSAVALRSREIAGVPKTASPTTSSRTSRTVVVSLHVSTLQM